MSAHKRSFRKFFSFSKQRYITVEHLVEKITFERKISIRNGGIPPFGFFKSFSICCRKAVFQKCFILPFSTVSFRKSPFLQAFLKPVFPKKIRL